MLLADFPRRLPVCLFLAPRRVLPDIPSSGWEANGMIPCGCLVSQEPALSWSRSLPRFPGGPHRRQVDRPNRSRWGNVAGVGQGQGVVRLRQRRREASCLRIKELETPDPVVVYKGCCGKGVGMKTAEGLGFPAPPDTACDLSSNTHL